MQQMEMLDYVNERPRRWQTYSDDANQRERRRCQLLFLSFAVLCIIQATLNVSLRLTLTPSKKSTCLNCNATDFSDQNQLENICPRRKNDQCNRLQEKFNALTTVKNRLENRNAELLNMVRDCERRRNDQCNRLQEKFNALTRDKNQLENRNAELLNMIKKVEEERDRLKINLRGLSGCVSSQQCPAGWRVISSRCYFLSTEAKTWEDSRRYCQSKGADLVVINSEQEQRDLYRLGGDVDLLFWIGLHDTSGTFKWVDGSALTKPFWQSGQPDRGGPVNAEDCVEMYHFNPVLANWNDAPCGSKRRWLCERPMCQ